MAMSSCQHCNAQQLQASSDACMYMIFSVINVFIYLYSTYRARYSQLNVL